MKLMKLEGPLTEENGCVMHICIRVDSRYFGVLRILSQNSRVVD
jgi:hypothetical protein